MGVGITGAPAWMAPGGRKPVSDGKWDWGLWAMRKVKGYKAWGHKNVVTSLTIPPHKPRKLRVKPRKNPQEKVGIETYPPPTPTILAMGGTGRTPPPHTHTQSCMRISIQRPVLMGTWAGMWPQSLQISWQCFLFSSTKAPGKGKCVSLLEKSSF